MIKLSNGHEFTYLATSGALGFNGKGWWWERPLSWLGLMDPHLFTIVIKTLTFRETKGNLKMYWPLGCIRLLFQGIRPIGTVNAVGLTNPGYMWWMSKVAPRVKASGLKLIASIKADSEFQLRQMATSLNMLDDLKGIQWNVSCPNTSDRDEQLRNENFIVSGCKLLKQISNHPLLIKLSEQHSTELVERLEGLVEAIEPNSVRWDRIFPDTQSPLARLGGGGVSGMPAQPLNWEFLRRVKKKSRIPIIGNGIWEYKDFDLLDVIGVDAYSFGSVHIPYPCRPTQFVRRHIKEAARANAPTKFRVA